MFKRKIPKTIALQIRDLIWPVMGWGRALRYMKLRLVRLSDPTHKVAGGLANGIAVSFSPLMGTHIVQAVILSFFTRTNMLAGATGTIIGNPWTFPFIWWASIAFGGWIFDVLGLPASTTLPENINSEIFWEIMFNEPLRLFLPWMVGGYLLGALLWLPSYYVFFYIVKGAKAARLRTRGNKK
jgi:uncharacterized protein (DUF2062 family)